MRNAAIRKLSSDGAKVGVAGVWRHPDYATFDYKGETGYRNDGGVLRTAGCGKPGYPGLYTRVSTFSSEITAQLGTN